MRSALSPIASARDVWAWAMYDFANSGYTTVVITAIFNAYFVAVVADNAPWATFAWTASLAVSYFLCLLMAPLIGAYADIRAAKKRLLVLATLGCVLFTAGLYFAQPGALAWAVLCLVLSNFFFGMGENLIAAFLPELAHSRGFGRVSGWGWGWGYFGGLLTLALCLGWIVWSEARGLPAAHAVPQTMLITAAVFLIASLPTLIFLPERAQPRAGRVADAWREVLRTLRETRRFPDLFRFLLASTCYQAGVQVVIALAAIYAQQAMGFSVKETLMLILAVNVAAAAGAFVFGHLQDRLGPVRALTGVLLGWLATVAIAASSTATSAFWLAAHLAGLCLGSSQAGGRALVGLLSPHSRRAEFFGFWGLAMKLSAILGPLSYGLVTWITANDHRQALLATAFFFLAGLWLIRQVDPVRGRRAALRDERSAKGGCR
ncbi:MAG: MFS transporter [Rhodocyclaceae bacterium]|nr:MFS transporter [Rhodocyclaceae bacterium]